MKSGHRATGNGSGVCCGHGKETRWQKEKKKKMKSSKADYSVCFMYSCLVAKSCPIFFFFFFATPKAYSPPGSSVPGTSQARILEWVAISFSRGPSRPKDGAGASCSPRGFFTTAPPRKRVSVSFNSPSTLSGRRQLLFYMKKLKLKLREIWKRGQRITGKGCWGQYWNFHLQNLSSLSQ